MQKWVKRQPGGGAAANSVLELTFDIEEPVAFSRLFLEEILSATNYALQPIVDVNTGAVYAYEALLRGHQALGFNQISEIFDTAYEHDCLVELEIGLRKKAVSKYADLPNAKDLKLFVNLDGRVLNAPNRLHIETTRMLAAHNLPKSALCVELSEQHKNSEANNAQDQMDLMRENGFRLALDDFGQGFSELKLLYDIEPDYVKIDRFFIKDIHTTSRKKLFVATVTNLAHVLGASVVAEGVETAEEFLACRQIGCDLIQGYFVERPFLDTDLAMKSYHHVRLATRSERRGKESDSQLIREEMSWVKPITDTAEIADVFDQFRESKAEPCVPIVDQHGEPRAIIREADMKHYIYSEFGRDLLMNKGLGKPLQRFQSRCPVADINSDVDTMLEIFANNAIETDGIILTDHGQYAGLLSAQSLLKIINEKRFKQAQDQNPLTKLPGNQSIHDFVASSSEQADTDRAYCYFDFNNFKPFNDRYGFRQGDRAIILFADLLKKAFGQGAFLGHVGGDDFFAGFKNADQALIRQQVETLLTTFEQDIKSFYDPEDRKAEYLEGQDRSGRPARFPLMRCCGAILTISKGVPVHATNHLSQAIAELKSISKLSENGLAIRDYSPAPNADDN
ncbi:GGDEF domain-containing protein [Coralliovum pocilloporae]|uniref:GGDEF domain-containing protein n=1 Tax=Coralliovum pocilloporae TaxID=3066369 RepID=UPI00330774CC